MYSDYYLINKNFQASINLELDLDNEAKLSEYIPTNDICDVLKRYIKSFLGIGGTRASTLVGPYGKGKSFLLLVLTYLVGNKKNSKCWTNLVEKIKPVDEELYSLLLDIKKKQFTLLPIIINSNYDNITQSFQIALNEALKRNGLEKIVPKSAFDICLALLDKWEVDKDTGLKITQKCAEINGLSIKELRIGLSNYSPDSFQKFEQLYNCVNIGLDFNPLINTDVVKTYKDVVASIHSYGYNGFFIVFDEFSKFIESNSSNLMKDLKIVQDFAENSDRSSFDSQLNLCCVTHKSISLYLNVEDKRFSKDTFKTVEGRFTEIRFNRSLDENYQIISAAIIKSIKAKDVFNRFEESHHDFYKSILDLNICNLSTIKRDLFEGCFPLNPLSVYCLISLSEIVAQNERTLFTFLSDKDDSSFNSFIHNNESGMMNVDKLYDYFSSLLQKEETNFIRNTWYRTESILMKIDNNIDKQIIKTLSVILMINDYGKLPPNLFVISLASGMNEEVVAQRLDLLIKNHFLRKNILNNLFSFALSNTKQIDDQISYLSKTKFKGLNYPEWANSINEKKYIIPRQYNEENKITRFFKVLFISETEFNNLENFSLLFEENYCDGIVLYLLRNNLSEFEIQSKIDHIADRRVIVKYPLTKIDTVFFDSLLRYACLDDIQKQKGLDEIVLNEIGLLIDETKEDIKTLINHYFEDNCKYHSFGKNLPSFNSTLSAMLSSIFTSKTIFNNELINKKNVSTQYQKAINHVIDYLLNIDGKKEFLYSKTSPEMSIRISVIDSNVKDVVVRQILDKIKEKIYESRGRKTSVFSITNEFSLPPYGIRLGVLSLLFAEAVSELSDNFILYFESKEIDLCSENIVKSICNDKYQFTFSRSSVNQKNYLYKMMKLFNCDSTNNFRKDTSNLSETIRRYFIGLPAIVRSSTENNNCLKFSKEYIAYKDLFLAFNINPFEVIFVEPKNIFGTNDYNQIYEKISELIGTEAEKIKKLKTTLLSDIKILFDIDNNTSFKSGITYWLNKSISKKSTPILEDKEREFFNFLKDKANYDDFDSVNQISKMIVMQFIEDWNKDRSNELLAFVTRFKEEIKNAKYLSSWDNHLDNLLTSDNVKISEMGTTLKNNLESTLDDYSGSVPSSEKIAILTDILKKLM